MLEREETSQRSKNILIHAEPKQEVIEQKVQVLYYLSRNGQLEHPHLMDVPISSPQGILSLKDVINRLSFLRGQGMANMYSWSTKRSYKNGFVWQDLTQNDFIYPSNGHEYVLKGTHLIEPSLSFRSYETISTPTSSKSSSETNNNNPSTDAESPASTIKGMMNKSLLIGDDYKLYKAKTFREFSGKAANASTQTDEKSRHKILERKNFVQECEGNDDDDDDYGSRDIRNQKLENERPSGRIKASAVLMQFIRCRAS